MIEFPLVIADKLNTEEIGTVQIVTKPQPLNGDCRGSDTPSYGYLFGHLRADLIKLLKVVQIVFCNFSHR